MKKLYLLLLLQSSVVALWAQPAQCTVLSIEQIGGNGSDGITHPGTIYFEDGTFAFTALTNSNEDGNIEKDCVLLRGTKNILLHYKSSGEYLGTSCMAQSPNFKNNFQSYNFPQSNGDTVIIGTTSSPRDYGIERYSADGELLWSKQYGGVSSQHLINAKQTTDGGFFLAGESYGASEDVEIDYGGDGFIRDTWIVKVDSLGEFIWGKVLGGTSEDRVSDIIEAPDGGCYVFGETESNDYDAIENHGSADLYVARLDNMGNLLWFKCYGGSGFDGSHDLRTNRPLKDGKGGFYIPALTASSDGDVGRPVQGFDFWLLHIDSAGTLLWENTYGGPGNQVPWNMTRDSNGNFWMIGYSDITDGTGGHVAANYGRHDGWVVQADSLGNFINSRSIGSDRTDEIHAVAPLSDGKVMVAGYFSGNPTPGSQSPGFPSSNYGGNDIFIAVLSPETDLSVDQVKPNNSQFKIYPNPSNGFVKIATERNETYQLQVWDMEGKTVFKGSFQQQMQLNTTEWAKGTYILNFSDNKGNQFLEKLVVP